MARKPLSAAHKAAISTALNGKKRGGSKAPAPSKRVSGGAETAEAREWMDKHKEDLQRMPSGRAGGSGAQRTAARKAMGPEKRAGNRAYNAEGRRERIAARAKQIRKV